MNEQVIVLKTILKFTLK